MGLRVIGAGVGRTGTTSLKLALEQLLGGQSYHMYEVFKHPAHTPLWRQAIHGEAIDWEAIYGDYVATVDWPGAAFWRPLSQTYPDALVLLSLRESPEVWFKSANETIGQFLQIRRKGRENFNAWQTMANELLRETFSPVPFDPAHAKAAYERHNAEVRATVPAERLLEWQVTDGWAPLCARLGLPVPDAPFPHANTRDEFQVMLDRGATENSWRSRLRRLVRSGR
jgi:sulfotransferase family protein